MSASRGDCCIGSALVVSRTTRQIQYSSKRLGRTGLGYDLFDVYPLRKKKRKKQVLETTLAPMASERHRWKAGEDDGRPYARAISE